jgi:hypothetical protein
MNIFAWFRTLWHKDAINKATETAKTLVAGLSTDQFQLVVDKVAQVSKEQISGLEKAAKVREIITNPAIVSAYRLPDWARDGINFASTIVQLAWAVAKITKRI